MLEAVQFPALVSRLDTRLTQVNRDAFCSDALIDRSIDDDERKKAKTEV